MRNCAKLEKGSTMEGGEAEVTRENKKRQLREDKGLSHLTHLSFQRRCATKALSSPRRQRVSNADEMSQVRLSKIHTENLEGQRERKRGIRCEKVKVEEGLICHELLGVSRLTLRGL